MPPQQIGRDDAQMEVHRARERGPFERRDRLVRPRLECREISRRGAQSCVERRDHSRQRARRKPGKRDAGTEVGVAADEFDDRREAEPVGDGEHGAAPRELDPAAEAAGGDEGGGITEAAPEDGEGVAAGL